MPSANASEVKRFSNSGKFMSRLAKRPIPIPQGAEVSVANSVVTVKGPLGTLTRPVHAQIDLSIQPEGVIVTARRENLETKALTGTYASHVRNMLEGATKGFTKRLAVEGVGYKWDVAGTTLNLSLGFSHPVKKQIPEGLKVTLEKNVLVVSGFDKEKVGQFAAEVRALKKPEPYKGKGIRYEGEIIRRKQGKKVA